MNNLYITFQFSIENIKWQFVFLPVGEKKKPDIYLVSPGFDRTFKSCQNYIACFDLGETNRSEIFGARK